MKRLYGLLASNSPKTIEGVLFIIEHELFNLNQCTKYDSGNEQGTIQSTFK